MSYAGRCALAFQAEILNLAVSGAKYDPRLSQAVPDWDCDFITVAYGTNDFNQSDPIDLFRNSSGALLDALVREYPGIPIFQISVLTWAERTEPDGNGTYIDDFRRVQIELAQKHEQVTLIPGTEMIPDEPAFFVDNVHKNRDSDHFLT